MIQLNPNHATAIGAQLANRTTNGAMLRQALELLGFPDFKEYRQSVFWDAIRVDALERFPLCFRCRAVAVDVHVASYDLQTLSGQRPDRLYSVCRRCFRKTCVAEFGAAWGLRKANRRLGLSIDIPPDEPIRRERGRRKPLQRWYGNGGGT